ncbi:MAG: amidohydrolase [Eubacteriales bacterium]|nr:amidohydrolase [Eubacteriales bacterium]
MLCIKNGTLHTASCADDRVRAFAADILIDEGKIREIGINLNAPEDCPVVDATGLQIYPGFVEAHCHTGLDGTAIGYEGQDYNEYNDPVTPQLRAVDGINPFDPAFSEAACAGVTCIATGPGSSNALGGTFAVIKTAGKRVDDMIVRAPAAMKCAFGENPKRCYREHGISSRMTNAALIREALCKALQYRAKKEAAQGVLSQMPAYDAKCEALLPVLNHEIPLKAHAHQANDFFTALRIAREFGLDITLEHVTEGHLVAGLLAAENVPLAVGPTFTHASKFELQNKSWTTPGILAKAGCRVSIITDAPVTPLHYLPLCAGLACRAGMSESDALLAITLNPARHLGVENRVGSLEEGKDADLVIADGSPLSMDTSIKAVYINGVEAHRA